MPFIRVRKAGLETIMFDLDKVRGWEIMFIEEFGEYDLIALCGIAGYTICSGSADKCHTILNKINQRLNIEIIDL